MCSRAEERSGEACFGPIDLWIGPLARIIVKASMFKEYRRCYC